MLSIWWKVIYDAYVILQHFIRNIHSLGILSEFHASLHCQITSFARNNLNSLNFMIGDIWKVYCAKIIAQIKKKLKEYLMIWIKMWRIVVCSVIESHIPPTIGQNLWSSYRTSLQLLFCFHFMLLHNPQDLNLEEWAVEPHSIHCLSLIHIWRCRRSYACRSRWSPYH